MNCADFTGARVVDVGTGAGFPGLPLAILRPDADFTLLDSQMKRIDFIAETAALLGDAVIEANDKKYPAQFTLGDYTWTGAADEALGVGYTTEINGETVSFMDYVVTPEGGDWYFVQTEAALLNAAGENAVTVEVNTKEGIGHGEDFWPSDLKYSGNIAAIEAYLVANGVDYDLTTAAQDESGVWTVADTTTGATLAGTTNYLRIAQEAYANAQ